MLRVLLPSVLLLLTAAGVRGQAPELEASKQFLAFIRASAAQLRAQDRPPATRAEWEARRAELRKQFQKAWGTWPETPAPLQPKVLGTLQRDGYRIERLLFQTFPGVWMTANAYVPDKPGKVPAILVVHGHWRGARLDPVVQRRCHGAAKLGFFVLAVDALGAGERGLSKNLGEYHGEMVAATLFPVGLPLSGLQVYENMRAVDYLRTRPEVDGSRIGITGASGGGNQSMYAGAWDERLGAAVPVCSVGNYQAYLGPACCMCEVVPGALRFTEEWGVLALTAPRGLLVVNATRDGIQFSVGEAKKSLERVNEVFKIYNQPIHLRHAIFESGHDYNQAMREAMYGWMTKHLKGEGDGQPIPEPALKTEEPETLRCFPGDSRPADWLTIPRFAAREARQLLAKQPTPVDRDQWRTQALRRRIALPAVLGKFPAKTPLGLITDARPGDTGRTLVFHPEPGLTLTATHVFGRQGPQGPTAIVLDLEGAQQATDSGQLKALRAAGWGTITLDLRATGQLAVKGDTIGRAPDHNSAEWSLWIGRPLLGQWVWDVVRLLDALEAGKEKRPQQLAIVGTGPAGVVALTAAALDGRLTQVAAVDTLASYLTEVPYQGQRLGLMVPGILHDVGDITHIAELCAPRRVVFAGGVSGSGEKLTAAQREKTFAQTRQVWQWLEREGEFQLLEADLRGVVQALTGRAE